MARDSHRPPAIPRTPERNADLQLPRPAKQTDQLQRQPGPEDLAPGDGTPGGDLLAGSRLGEPAAAQGRQRSEGADDHSISDGVTIIRDGLATTPAFRARWRR